MDLFVGDLPLFIELTELRDYDIFTYTQGDTENLYLRGQFAPHRNTPSVNALFLRCGPSTGWTRVTLGARGEARGLVQRAGTSKRAMASLASLRSL